MNFWILRLDDGEYYCKGKSSGWGTVEGTTDILRAERFDSAEDAKFHHDAAGHFYHQRMTAVRVCLVIDDSAEVDLPGLSRSVIADEDRS